MLTVVSVLIMAALVGLDQLTKWLAVANLQGTPRVLWEGVFELRYTENDGIAWGMLGSSFRWPLIIGTALVMAVLVYLLFNKKYRGHWMYSVSLMMIIAGGVGNLIDRIFRGVVVDFLYFKLINFPIFNVADCFVTVGAALLLIYLLFFSDFMKTPEKKGTQDGASDVDSSSGDGGKTA